VASTRTEAAGLPLAAYAESVSLGDTFERCAGFNREDRAAAVGQLISRLLREKVPDALRAAAERAREGHDARQLLRALLAVRLPGALPGELASLLDGVLAGELQDRGIVDGGAVPTVTPHPAFIPPTAVALWLGDITQLRVDVVVNAANAELLGCFRPMHACIDNAIHAAAGPQLREDCARIMALQGHAEPTGCAKATRAYNLPARFVVHTVGPIVQGAVTPGHARALADCYRSCLDLAAELPGVRSMALCGISTGVFGYPKAPAASIAVGTVSAWLQKHPTALDLIVFNVFSDEDRAAIELALAAAPGRQL